MRIKGLRHIFFFSFLLVIVRSNSQSAWTLSQCIEYALSHNLQVKQSALNVDQSKAVRDQSYAAFLPFINGQVSHNTYFGRFVDPYTNSYTNQEVRSASLGLSASMTLFEGFQLQNTLSQSNLNFMASRKDLEKIRNDISLNVVAAYLTVLYNQDLFVVLENQVNATIDQRNRMRRMYELGSASKANYLDLEAQVASDSASVVSGKAQLDQSMLTLTQLLELTTQTGFNIEHPVLPELPSLTADLTPDLVYAIALNTQPQVKSSELRRMAAEKGLAAARGARYPRLFIGGNFNTNYSTSNQRVAFEYPGTFSSYLSGYTTTGDSVFTVVPDVIRNYSRVPFWDQFNNNRGSGIALSLQLPVFNGWSTRTNLIRSRVSMEQSRLNEQQVRNDLFKSVQQAVLDAQSASHKVEANTRSVESLREAAAFARQRFELGLINTYEFSLAKNNLLRGEANQLQAKYDFLFRVKVLDFYQGKPLTF